MKIIFAVALATLPFHTFARDINLIDPSELPITVWKSYTEKWHGGPQTFPPGYGVDQAMKSTDAEDQCMAEVGRQLTDWRAETTRVAESYWSYSISAELNARRQRCHSN